MDQHTLRVLEFDKIRQFLASFAAAAATKRRCAELQPAATLSTARELLAQTSEMRREIETSGLLALAGIHDIRPLLERARVENAHLEPLELLHVRDTLETAGILKNYFSGQEESCPLLCGRAEGIVVLDGLIKRIQACIGSDGTILDAASQKLYEIRSRLRTLRRSILSALEGQFSDEQISYAVQDDFITLRNNRYVIPVRSDSKSTIPGVVHDQSQSGATFFVEPLAVVTLNNEIQVLRKEEQYEVLRILIELTSAVDADELDIRSDLDILELIDGIHARARMSIALGASAPALDTAGELALRGCRHPILLARFSATDDAVESGADPDGSPAQGVWTFDRPEVTPIDLLKPAETNVLVITGANAGGKTVALKTAGLFVLMAQSGIQLPADPGGTIPFYRSVYADIGDEQNIEANLSTFSAHMAQIKTIVDGADAASLVLVDELGVGTDPSEGGALSVAILDHLRLTRCTAIVTTHLTVLKTYAYQQPDVTNVSVDFDTASHRPLYRLVYGMPGISNALAIARRIGIPDAILSRAALQLDQSDAQVSALIQGLEHSQRDLQQQKSRFAQAIAIARQYQQTAQRLLDAMQKRRDTLLQEFASEGRKLLRSSEDEIKRIMRELKRTRLLRPDSPAGLSDTTKAEFTAVKQRLQKAFPRSGGRPEPVRELSAGQTVTVFHLKKTGTVVAADNRLRRAEVVVGTLRIKTGYDELELLRTPPQQRQRPSPTASVHIPEPVREKQVNVIGMRVDDALPVVDKALDEALVQHTEQLEIIHGRGTGRLMQAIQAHLKDLPGIRSFGPADPEKGGLGVTVVYLK